MVVGWYKNNLKHGNWMMLKASNKSILKSGFFRNNIRLGDMKDDEKYKNFNRDQIFKEKVPLSIIQEILDSKIFA